MTGRYSGCSSDYVRGELMAEIECTQGANLDLGGGEVGAESARGSLPRATSF